MGFLAVQPCATRSPQMNSLLINLNASYDSQLRDQFKLAVGYQRSKNNDIAINFYFSINYLVITSYLELYIYICFEDSVLYDELTLFLFYCVLLYFFICFKTNMIILFFRWARTMKYNELSLEIGRYIQTKLRKQEHTNIDIIMYSVDTT